MLRRERLLRMTTNASMDYLEKATRNLFFTGKGGVGKTTLACATAIALADRGKRVLLVSTDPASNLDEVLGVSLSNSPTPVPGVAGLFALNVDPEAAAREYRERVVGPYRGVLPAAAIASMEEQLSGSCTVEIAAFDEFSRLLGDPKATAEFDHVLFDTAPTGHTLRLLSLPSAWTGFIAANTTGTSCLGPLAGLQKQRELYQATIEALSNGDIDNAGPCQSSRAVRLDRSGTMQPGIGVIGREQPTSGRQWHLPCVGSRRSGCRRNGTALSRCLVGPPRNTRRISTHRVGIGPPKSPGGGCPESFLPEARRGGSRQGGFETRRNHTPAVTLDGTRG